MEQQEDEMQEDRVPDGQRQVVAAGLRKPGQLQLQLQRRLESSGVDVVVGARRLTTAPGGAQFSIQVGTPAVLHPLLWIVHYWRPIIHSGDFPAANSGYEPHAVADIYHTWWPQRIVTGAFMMNTRAIVLSV